MAVWVLPLCRSSPACLSQIPRGDEHMATLLPTGAAASDAPLWGAASSVEIAHGVPVAAGPPLSSSAVDAVPLIDQTTAALLSQVTAFSVVQRPSLSEALFAACERSNIYDVYDGQSGAHLFFAKERSETCARFCCAPNHALFVEFKVPVEPETFT